MANVTYDHVTKRFDGTVAVDDLTLDVADSEFIVLVGPSGCGKSTALRMLAGLEKISDGRILIGDRVVNNVAPQSRDIAMVFQSYALYPHMTVYDNLAFALRNHKVAKPEIDRRVQRAADLQLALGDVLEPGDHAQRGRLAAAGRPDEDHELAVPDLEVHLLDSLVPVRVALRDVVHDDFSHKSP